MKTIAIKVEAGLKRLVSDLAGLESSELELLALKDELLNAGANQGSCHSPVASKLPLPCSCSYSKM